MEKQQIVIPEFVMTLVGRHVVMAEIQRLQDAATIAALREDAQRLSPSVPVAEPPSANGAARETVGAIEE